MDLRPGRQALIRALTDAGVVFLEYATLKQLKTLYASLNSDEDWEDDTKASGAGYDCNGTKEGAAMPVTVPAVIYRGQNNATNRGKVHGRHNGQHTQSNFRGQNFSVNVLN